MNDSNDSIGPEIKKYIDDLIDGKIEERIGCIENKIEECLAKIKENSKRGVSERATIVVFSGDFDKLFAAFIIATGSVAMGLDVSMYFTFWGLAAIKKGKVFAGKSISEKMIAAMFPSGPDRTGTSKMNMLGMGPVFFKSLMKKNHAETLPDLIDMAQEMNIRMVGCEMSMDIMGIKKDELLDGIEYGGVATYLGDASDSKITLFI